MKHDAAWYALQERRCLEAIREAEKKHTAQEVAEAEATLAARAGERQEQLPMEVQR